MEEITKIELDEDDQVLGVFEQARVVSLSENTGVLVLELHSRQSARGLRHWRLLTNARDLLELSDMLQRQIAPTPNHKIQNLLSNIEKKLDRLHASDSPNCWSPAAATAGT